MAWSLRRRAAPLGCERPRARDFGDPQWAVVRGSVACQRHSLRGLVELAAGVRGLSAVYYATLLVVGAGLTVLLGYEIAWLAARSRTALVMASLFVPWVVFAAWSASDDR